MTSYFPIFGSLRTVKYTSDMYTKIGATNFVSGQSLLSCEFFNILTIAGILGSTLECFHFNASKDTSQIYENINN